MNRTSGVLVAAALAWCLALARTSSDEEETGRTGTTPTGTGGSATGGSSAGGGGTSAGGSGAIVCDLGTVYPDRGVINPDDPVYEDELYTQAQVTQMFAEAKAQDTKAYRGYKAAYLYAELLRCAWCACGCERASLGGHLSATDCFKDMHGFL